MTFPNPPRTWVAGETVTAALLNAEVRDALNAIGLWQTWSPTWGASGTAPVLGNGTLVGKYLETPNWVELYIHLTAGSTTTFGTGTWKFDLPVSAPDRRFSLGGMAVDTSAPGDYPILFRRAAANEVNGRCDSTTAGSSMRGITNSNPFTWATGDELWVTGRYPKA